MPAEGSLHARCWMAWPCREELWRSHREEARAAFARVARAIRDFEPVTVLARPEDAGDAVSALGAGIEVVPAALDDSWMRDIGPTFVTDDSGNVAGVHWRFNGWGEKYRPYAHDAEAGAFIISRLGLPCFPASIVMEGGAISVDGEGTAMVTEECLLNPNRNPSLTRREIEEILEAYLGVRRVIWLGQGLVNDETDGHVDNVACFVRPGVVLLAAGGDSANLNAQRMNDNRRRLDAARDGAGRRLKILSMPLPRPREGDDGKSMALSYMNFYIANGGIVMPGFGSPVDGDAADVLRRAFPERKIVQVPSLAISHGGGNIHCITQQEPLPARKST
ncbi:MAG: agmatine deiminase family protein [Rhodospirillales bacterium]|nr:agmatine deiminase family protein [Rhodospirillales bacterium]